MKSALVTGSAKRLGKELALNLARLGFNTWVHYNTSRQDAQYVLDEIRQQGGNGGLIRGDVSQLDDVQAMMKLIRDETGSLDVLINNVGIYKPGPLLEYPVEDFEKTLQTNLMGAYYLIREAIPFFPLSGGSILNIGYSGVDNVTSSIHNTAYLVSKSGLLTLTKSYAEALGSKNIRVNMISPGVLANSVELPDKPEEYIPLGTLGACSDVAAAMEFLISDKARYITGINLDVAGGYMLGLKAIS